MPYITDINATEVLDVFGNPTIKVEIETENGPKKSVSLVNTNVSRDALRFSNNTVSKDLSAIQDLITPEVIGYDCRSQRGLDEVIKRLSQSLVKNKISSSTFFLISYANLLTGALFNQMPLYNYVGGYNVNHLPNILVNVYSNDTTNLFKIYLEPIKQSSFKENLSIIKEIEWQISKNNINFKNNDEALANTVKVIKECGFVIDEDVKIILDCEASKYYQNGIYQFPWAKKQYTYKELTSIYESLCTKYPISLLINPLIDTDQVQTKHLLQRLNNKTKVSFNNYLVNLDNKPNKELKTLSFDSFINVSSFMESINKIKRSGVDIIYDLDILQVNDSSIIDFLVGLNATYIKLGSLTDFKNIIMCNRLIEIEEELRLNIDTI